MLAGRSLAKTLLAAFRDARCAADMIFLAEVNPSPGQSSVEMGQLSSGPDPI
jgi:hypothetical protein